MRNSCSLDFVMFAALQIWISKTGGVDSVILNVFSMMSEKHASIHRHRYSVAKLSNTVETEYPRLNRDIILNSALYQPSCTYLEYSNTSLNAYLT